MGPYKKTTLPRLVAAGSDLVTLFPERAALGESSSTAGRLAQNRLAVSTHHHSLRVAKYGCYVEAALTFDIHEEGIGRLNKTLELVLLLLELGRRVQQIDVVLENHCLRYERLKIDSGAMRGF